MEIEEQGKKIVTAIVVILIAISIASMVFSYFTFGSQTLLFQTIGLIATGVVCYYLSNRKKWAKNLITVSMALGVFSSMATAMTMILTNQFAFIYLVTQGTIYSATLGLLLFSRPIKEYMRFELEEQ